jgi:hypothetical protein
MLTLVIASVGYALYRLLPVKAKLASVSAK